jgi:hypothetical protein
MPVKMRLWKLLGDMNHVALTMVDAALVAADVRLITNLEFSSHQKSNIVDLQSSII